MTQGLGDAELVARCRAGDQSAWRALVERHGSLVNGLLRGVYRLSATDAEDGFQETFTRVYVRLESVREPAALRGWIAQIARNVALDLIRSGSRERPGEGPVEECGVEDPLGAVEEAWGVRAALERLPDHQREILDRFFTQDQSYRTISAELGIAPGTIASRISRALAALRQELEGRSQPSRPSS